MRKILTGAAALAGALVLSLPAQAQVRINELVVNPPGTDNGFEYLELSSTSANFDFANFGGAGGSLWFLAIEGDGASPGVVDVAINLSSPALLTDRSTGANRLFLFRDSAGAISPAPSPQTNIRVQDFNPDIENGSNTYLLVRNFSGTVGTSDVDANNDGVLDAVFWSSVVDGIALLENDGAANVGYATELGFIEVPQVSFTPDQLFRTADTGEWVASDLLGTLPGPLTIADAENWRESTGAAFSPTTELSTNLWTPGGDNPIFSAAVPEPTSLALLGLAGAGFGYVRFRKRGQQPTQTA